MLNPHAVRLRRKLILYMAGLMCAGLVLIVMGAQGGQAPLVVSGSLAALAGLGSLLYGLWIFKHAYRPAPGHDQRGPFISH